MKDEAKAIRTAKFDGELVVVDGKKVTLRQLIASVTDTRIADILRSPCTATRKVGK